MEKDTVPVRTQLQVAQAWKPRLGKVLQRNDAVTVESQIVQNGVIRQKRKLENSTHQPKYLRHNSRQNAKFVS